MLEAQPHYVKGVVVAFLGGVSLSFGGVMFRFVDEAGSLQVLFYRSLGFAIGALVYVLVNRRGQLISAFRGIGKPGLAASVILGLAIPFYTLSILKISVANSLFVVSTSPLFAAVVGLIVLRERVKPITWLAAGVALVGVCVMLYGAFTAEVEAGFDTNLIVGNLMSLGAALGLGSYAVALRFRVGADMSPSLILAGAISALIAIVPIYGDIAVSRFDLILCLAMGLQGMLGFALLTFGAKYIPAAEVALLSLMEVMLGPVWVELFVGEAVDDYTLVGGPIVLAAVLAFSIVGVRDARRRRSERREAAGRRADLPDPPLPSGEREQPSVRPDMTGALAYALRRAERAEAGTAAGGAVAASSDYASGARSDGPAPSVDPFAEAARYMSVEYRLRERLNPVLREWVETNLPRVTESLVRGEVRRLVDRAEDTWEDSK